MTKKPETPPDPEFKRAQIIEAMRHVAPPFNVTSYDAKSFIFDRLPDGSLLITKRDRGANGRPFALFSPGTWSLAGVEQT